MDVEGFKLVRIGQGGCIYPLFINRQEPIPFGMWMPAEDHTTKGFASRPGWHATLTPNAPHLKMRLSSGEQRIWVSVLLRGTTMYNRPESQGGTWVLAEEMKVTGYAQSSCGLGQARALQSLQQRSTSYSPEA